MKRLICLIIALACGAPALAADPSGAPQGGHRGGSPANSYANPSAVIAAELAFAQAAQARGEWSAFAEFAAPDAVMFVPAMTWAQTWLKGRANPPAARKWQPQEVWSSCDGSVIVSHGAWQGAEAAGWFTTIWQRQPDGRYKWVLRHDDSLRAPLAVPEMIAAHVADCPERRARGDGAPAARPAKPKKIKLKDLPPLDPHRRSGKSQDGSLNWEVTVDPSGARNLSVDWRKDGATGPVLIEQVAAPGAGMDRPGA